MSSRDFSDFRAAQAVADSTFHRDELSSCVRVSLGEVCDPPLLSQLLVHPSEKKKNRLPRAPIHTYTYVHLYARASTHSSTRINITRV